MLSFQFSWKNRLLLAVALIWLGAIFWGMLQRPFWLDELLHIQVSRLSWSEVVPAATRNVGATPVTYIPQFLLANFVASPEVSGRLPAFLAFLLTLWLLQRSLRSHGALVAGAACAFLAVMPLAVRYAIEARPYSVLLLVTVCLCRLCERLVERPRRRDAIAYGLLTLIGTYTLPILIVVPLWHAAYLALNAFTIPRSSLWSVRTLTAPLSILLAAVCLMPWYTYAARGWEQAIDGMHITSTISPGTALMFLREITGGGYAGLLAVLPLAVLGTTDTSTRLQERLLWLSGIVLMALAVLVIDLTFGYMFAIRQCVAILIPICVLCGLGFRRLWNFKPRLGKIYLAASLSLLTFLAAKWMLHSDEDWQKAAQVALELNEGRGCIVASPLDTTPLFSIANPRVSGTLCDKAVPWLNYPQVLVIDTGYGFGAEASEGERVMEHGFQRKAERSVGRMVLSVYAAVPVGSAIAARP